MCRNTLVEKLWRRGDRSSLQPGHPATTPHQGLSGSVQIAGLTGNSATGPFLLGGLDVWLLKGLEATEKKNQVKKVKDFRDTYQFTGFWGKKTISAWPYSSRPRTRAEGAPGSRGLSKLTLSGVPHQAHPVGRTTSGTHVTASSAHGMCG